MTKRALLICIAALSLISSSCQGNQLDLIPPLSTLNLRGEAGKSYVLLNWDIIAEDDFDSYLLYRSDKSSKKFEPISAPTRDESGYRDKHVETGKEYRYRLTALDNRGNESDFSNEVVAIPNGLKSFSLSVSNTDIISGIPFSLTIVASDYLDSNHINYNGTVGLTLSAGEISRAQVSGFAGGKIEEDLVIHAHVPSLTLIATDSRDTNASGSLILNVVEDSDPPTITHLPAIADQAQGLDVLIRASITDNASVSKTTLFYKPDAASSYDSAPMNIVEGGGYLAAVPSGSVALPGVTYYIEAVDPSSNTATTEKYSFKVIVGPKGMVTLNREIYFGLLDVALLTLTDAGLNIMPEVVETATVLVTSDTDPSGELIVLSEIDQDAGSFQDTFGFEDSLNPGNGKIAIKGGDTITLTYQDSDRGDGSPETIVLNALWSDQTQSQVVINEYLPNPNLDYDGDGSSSDSTDEYIELYNRTDASLDLGGWKVNGVTINEGTVIAAKGYIFIARGDPEGGKTNENITGTTTGYSGIFGSLSNSGADSFILNDGTVDVDAVSWEGSSDGRSFAREPDGSSGWNNGSIPTPGASNEALWSDDDEILDSTEINTSANYGDVVINEIMWDGAEYIELRNTTNTIITMTGWTLADDNGIISTFTSTHSIGADGYFLIEDATNATTVDEDTVTPMTLNNSDGELIVLKDGLGNIIDSANQLSGGWFAGSDSEESMERKNPFGDGTDSDDWYTSTGNIGGRKGTPGAANSVILTPPSLTNPQATPNSAANDDSTLTLLTVQVTEAGSGVGEIKIDLSPIGGSSDQALHDDGTNGDIASGDNTYSYLTTVLPGTPAGEKNLTVSAFDTSNAISSTVNITLTVTQVLNSSANYGDVVINEIMWDGAEYTELRNTTSDAITMTGWTLADDNGIIYTFTFTDSVGANGYFLIEDATNATTMAEDTVTPMTLNNSDGELIVLKDRLGNIIDSANQVSGGWFAGSDSEEAMERKTPPGSGTDSGNWHTSVGNIGGRKGTPAAVNSVILTPPSLTNPQATPNSLPNDGSTATLLTVDATTTGSGIGTVQVDLSALGGSVAQSMYDDGSNGDFTASDNRYSYQTTVDTSSSPGSKNLTITAFDSLNSVSTTATISLTITASQGSTINPGDIVINEYIPNPDIDYNDDSSNTDTTDEYIELYNTTIEAINLGGWTVNGVIIITSTTIQPNDYILLIRGDPTGGNTNPNIFATTTGFTGTFQNLNNSGTHSFSLSDGTQDIDSVSWSGSTKGKSYSREPDGSSNWNNSATPTPGAANE